jgi:hypothetical protein
MNRHLHYGDCSWRVPWADSTTLLLIRTANVLGMSRGGIIPQFVVKDHEGAKETLALQVAHLHPVYGAFKFNINAATPSHCGC